MTPVRTALVTGAAGFVGLAVADGLRQAGVRIVAATRSGRTEAPGALVLGPPPWSASTWRAALEETRPDFIIHLAGAMKGSEEELEASNVGSAQGLIEALRQTGMPCRALLAGSAAEYGGAIRDGEPVAEDAVCQPQAPYGRSKLRQTEAALEAIAAWNAPLIAARIFNPVGPGMPAHLALGDFARQIAMMPAGQDRLVTGNLDVERDMMSPQQVFEAIWPLLNGGASGVVNICTGRAWHLRALVERMIAASGRRIRIEVDSSRIRPGEVRVIVGSVARLEALGALPAPVDIGALAPAILDHARERAAAPA